MVSTILVLVVQILGFTVFPGLLKGMAIISEENVARSGVMLFVSTAGHFLLFVLVRILRFFC